MRSLKRENGPVDPFYSGAQPASTSCDLSHGPDVSATPTAAPTQRSPGILAGYSVTGTERSSAVRRMRFCSPVWAAG